MPVQALLDRLAKIDAASEKYRMAIDNLAKEAAEIKTALQVLQRYGIAVDVEGGTAAKEMPKGDRPTVPEMILQITRDHEVLGGATGIEVLDQIRKRWMPEADSNVVRPTLWRMVKDGRLAKKDERYLPLAMNGRHGHPVDRTTSLEKNEAPTGEPGDASESLSDSDELFDS